MVLAWEKTLIALMFNDALTVSRAARQDPLHTVKHARYFNNRFNERRENII